MRAVTLLTLTIALVLGCGSKNDDPDPGAVAGAGAAGATMAPPLPATMGPSTPAPGTAGTTMTAPPAQTAGAPSNPSSTTQAGSGGSSAVAAGSGGASAQAGDTSAAGSGGMPAEAGSMATPDPGAPKPSAGCSAGTIKAGHTNETIMVGGRQRQYVQHIPMAYDGKKPFAVLLDFHGGTYDGPRWDARASNKFKNMSETEQFLYISPTGLNAWWTTTDGAMGADGMFMRALIDKLKQNACVDERRVYSTGCSMGGDMSFYMACYLSDVIAASLPMCGTMSFPLTDCKPTRPISVRFIMGSQDSLNCWEPPRTSVGNPCASEVLSTFKMLNECTDTAEMTLNGKCKTHDQCKGGTEASVCLLNATHTGIYQSTDMDVYTEGWKFLKSFTLP